MADFARMRQDFPSRQYPYHVANRLGFGAASLDMSEGKTYRFIMGRDAAPVLLTNEDGKRSLSDPFAQLILLTGNSLPRSLRTLLARLNQFDTDAIKGLPVQNSFVVADGGHIPWTPETDDLQRAFRFAITRRAKDAHTADLLVSASTDLDSETAFLQVIGWDPAAGAYQFYERRGGSWIWAGSSWDALESDSRGKGPFDSHVNGALNMKELKQPWVNWHSEASRILDAALAPDDPLRQEPLWKNRSPAEAFETEVVRPGIRQWTNSRIAAQTKQGRLERFPHFTRQVVETTTVNLISSPVSSAALANVEQVPLPVTFFVHADALVDLVGIAPQITAPSVPASVYRDTLVHYDVALTDGKHRIPGDTKFVFVVPEPSFEDAVVIESLLTLGVLSPKFVASLLMVDFCNPVFSSRRAALAPYFPPTAPVNDAKSTEAEFVSRLRQSHNATIAGSPEVEFLDNWSLSERTWTQEFQGRIEQFFVALSPMLTDKAAFFKIFALAESRRREFRKRPLAEFRLTTPVTNIPEDAPLLEFAVDGSIHPKI
ncbi:MAG TPA: hypothetical protein VF427_15640 [Noviherbaspirillum sp.]